MSSNLLLPVRSASFFMHLTYLWFWEVRSAQAKELARVLGLDHVLDLAQAQLFVLVKELYVLVLVLVLVLGLVLVYGFLWRYPAVSAHATHIS